MSDTVNLALRQAIQLHAAVLVALTWFSLAKQTVAEITDQTKLFPEQNEGNLIILFIISIFFFFSALD